MSGPEPEAGALNWQRVHPASPFVRGWLALVALVLVYWQNTDEWSWAERFTGPRLYWTLVLAGAALLAILAGYFLSWYFTRYALSSTHVYVNTGMVFRSAKTARLDKVQGIDIAQPLVARLLGLAELRFDVADGGESVLKLAYLRTAHAESLRAEILAAARGQQAPATAPAPAAPAVSDGPAGPAEPERQPAGSLAESGLLVEKVPAGRTIAALLLQLPAIIGILVLLVFGVLWLAGIRVAIGGLLPALFGFGSWLYHSLNSSWNFTAHRVGDSVQISYGLADTRSHTIPLHRIQGIEASTPLLWRLLGWYRLEVNVLGSQDEDAKLPNLRMLPVGSFDSVAALMGLLLPDPGTPDPRGLLRTAVSTGDGHGFTTSPRAARLLSPFAFKHQGFVVTDTAVVTRFGWLCRRAVFVPHHRIQGLAWHQGPLERRRALAGVSVQCAGGNIMGRLHQIDQDAAAAFFHAQRTRISERQT